jgi:DNA-binding GntR family transcriptional regulator
MSEAGHPDPGTEAGSPSGRFYSRLRAAIMNGEFAPQQALKPQELANDAGVSLAVARESLLRLVGEGLAVRLPNRGFAAPAADADRWQKIAEARSVVEPAVLRLSIAHGDLEWEARVRAAHHRLARTPVRSDGQARVSAAWSEAHRVFHRALLDGCGNDVLLGTVDQMWTASELARHWSGSFDPGRDAPAEHAALEAAALDRDPDRATGLLARHITRTAAVLASEGRHAHAARPVSPDGGTGSGAVI